MNAVLAGLIVAGGDYPAAIFRAANGHRQPRQGGVIANFDGCKETVAIAVNDLAGHGA